MQSISCKIFSKFLISERFRLTCFINLIPYEYCLLIINESKKNHSFHNFLSKFYFLDHNIYFVLSVCYMFHV